METLKSEAIAATHIRTALKGVPVQEIGPPEGVINVGGEWYYEEYTAGTGVRALAGDEADGTGEPPAPADETEKRSIMDLFGSGEITPP